MTGFRLNDTRLSESEKEKYEAMETKRLAGFKGYLTAPETSAIIRWAHSQLEELRAISPEVRVGSSLDASLSFYEGLILKLEGHKDNATQTENRG
jgi:hypothetical protein